VNLNSARSLSLHEAGVALDPLDAHFDSADIVLDDADAVFHDFEVFSHQLLFRPDSGYGHFNAVQPAIHVGKLAMNAFDFIEQQLRLFD